MAIEQLAEGSAGIAGATEDGDGYFMHIQCIIIMQPRVNWLLSPGRDRC